MATQCAACAYAAALEAQEVCDMGLRQAEHTEESRQRRTAAASASSFCLSPMSSSSMRRSSCAVCNTRLGHCRTAGPL